MRQRITFALLCVTLLFNSFSGVMAQRPVASRGKSSKPSLYAQPPRDIVETVALSGQFAALTKAIKAAEMTNALSQAGPFTVFAPTDDAFQKVAAMPDLLEPTGREQLSIMLKYHIVQGKVLAAELREGQKLLTLNGESLTVTVSNGHVLVEGAELVQPNVMAANGVVHVVNRVLLPVSAVGNK